MTAPMSRSRRHKVDLHLGRAVATHVAATLIALTACSTAHDAMPGDAYSRCVASERHQLPQVRARMEEMLTHLVYTAEFLSHCEETNSPDATLIASIPSWSKRRVALRYLARRGWVVKDGVATSPDREVEASVSVFLTTDHGGQVVEISSSLA